MSCIQNVMCIVIVLDMSINRTWWWDSWVEPNNLYHIFKPISTFVSRLQLSSYDWNLVSPQVSPNTTYNLRAWGMAGENEGKEMIVTWIQDDCYTWAHQNSGQSCATLSGLMLTVSCNLNSGTSYNVGILLLLVSTDKSIIKCAILLLLYIPSFLNY